MVAVVRFGVTKGEPVNGIATELALYQTGLPVVQDADNEAVVLLQILGLEVPVGAETAFIETFTATKPLKQVPLSQRTL